MLADSDSAGCEPALMKAGWSWAGFLDWPLSCKPLTCSLRFVFLGSRNACATFVTCWNHVCAMLVPRPYQSSKFVWYLTLVHLLPTSSANCSSAKSLLSALSLLTNPEARVWLQAGRAVKMVNQASIAEAQPWTIIGNLFSGRKGTCLVFLGLAPWTPIRGVLISPKLQTNARIHTSGRLASLYHPTANQILAAIAPLPNVWLVEWGKDSIPISSNKLSHLALHTPLSTSP